MLVLHHIVMSNVLQATEASSALCAAKAMAFQVGVPYLTFDVIAHFLDANGTTGSPPTLSKPYAF